MTANDSPDPRKLSNQRIEHIIELFTSQNQLTWTVVSVSIAGQLILAGLFFQQGVTVTAQIILGLVALFSALIFGVIISQSRIRTDYYLALLAGTGRIEFRFKVIKRPRAGGSLRTVGDFWERVKEIPRRLSQPATIISFYHGGWVSLWAILLLLLGTGFLA